MALHFKRSDPHRDQSFRRPPLSCFACGDSGVIQNGDGLVNTLLFPDYDRLPDGRPLAGSDLPLICCCRAAHGGIGRDGSRRTGYIGESGGLLNPRLGLLLDEAQRDRLHRRRLAAWNQSEHDMDFARQLRSNGDPLATPGFVSETRARLLRLAAQQDSRQPTAGGFSSLAACLSSVITGETSGTAP